MCMFTRAFAEDADKVIALKPEWEKGWWRKAEALEAAERHQEALEVRAWGQESAIGGAAESTGRAAQSRLMMWADVDIDCCA